MLGELPSEVLASIAHHLILATGGPPVDLICTCRGACLALSPATNEGLYASVFRQLYDVSAIDRRLYALEGAEPVGKGKGKAKAGAQVKAVSAVPSIASLQSALERPRAAFHSAASSVVMSRATSYDGNGGTERALGASAHMLTAELENRVLAFRKLDRGEVDEQAMWVVFLMLIENDGKNISHLVPPLSPGPGADVPAILQKYHARTLSILENYPPQTPLDALVMWCAWLLDDYMPATPASMRQLRPYVFAAQQYDMFFAPWTLRSLPMPPDRSSIPPPPGPFTVKQTAEDESRPVSFYGSVLPLRAPLLTHAAMLRFFTHQDTPDPSSHIPSPSPASADDELRALPRPSLSSLSHDADFHRLLRCTDGRSSPGRKLRDWAGRFAGAWEGNFTFVDFDAFREMLLDGHARAIYTGAYGEQAQVWKLRETLVRPILATRTSTTTSRGNGGAAAAGTSSGQSLDEFPLQGPMTNAAFPELRPFASDPLARRAPGQSPEDAMIDDAVRRQLDAMHGYEAVEAHEALGPLGAVGAGGGATGGAGGSGEYEEALDDPHTLMLLTGVGHSAWGRFYISGYVRSWDGLAYLIKEYSPYQRGKWVYRGYVLQEGTMVGRWRDTFTAEEYVGYEGTFVLQRRSEG